MKVAQSELAVTNPSLREVMQKQIAALWGADRIARIPHIRIIQDIENKIDYLSPSALPSDRAASAMF